MVRPKYWYLQRFHLDGEPFWDSYMHTGCVLLKKRDYEQSPFKHGNTIAHMVCIICCMLKSARV